MSSRSFMHNFEVAIGHLSESLNLSQITLDENKVCQLKYKKELTIEITPLLEGGMEIQADIVPIYKNTFSDSLYRKLLEMNINDETLYGCKRTNNAVIHFK